MNRLNYIVKWFEFLLVMLFVVVGASALAMLLVYGLGFVLGISAAEIAS